MTKVLAIGFKAEEVKPVEGLIIAVHVHGLINGMTAIEQLRYHENIGKEADVVMINGDNQTELSPEEVILIYSAYSSNSPIFLVRGDILQSTLPTFLIATVTNLFNEYEELIEHIKIHYTKTLI